MTPRRPRGQVRPSVTAGLAGVAGWLGWAGLALLVLVVLPVMVGRVVGWPLPHRMPTWEQVRATLTTRYPDQRIYLDILACLFWYVWFTLTACLPVELAVALRGRRRPRLPIPGPGQALAAALIGGLLLHPGDARSHTAPRSPGDAVALAAVRAAATAPLLAGTTPVAASAAPGPAPDTGPQQTPARFYTVIRGDTLWDIADRQLGDPLYYRELFALNAGRIQPDGASLSDPNLIRPGWTLLLPALAAPPAQRDAASRSDPTGAPDGRRPAGPSPAASSPNPDPVAAAGHGATAAPAPAPVVTSPHGATAAPRTNPPAAVSGAPAPWTPAVSSPVTPPPATTAPPTHERPPPPGDVRPAAPDRTHGIPLPSGAIVGMGLLAAVAAAVTLARLLRQRRRPVPTPPGEPVPTDPPLPIIVREILRASRTPAPADEDNDFAHNDLSLPGPPPVAVGNPPSPPPGGGDELPGVLARAGSLNLDGPGAPAAARAIAVTLLADHHRYPRPDRPWPARLIIPTADADRLAMPRPVLAVLLEVTVTPTLPAALDRLHAELLHRHRLMAEVDTESIAELRRAAPDEMLPTVLLVATVEGDSASRLTALAAQGRPFGLYTLALGHWPGQTSYFLDANGRQTAPGGGAGEQWWQLSPAAAGDLLDLVAAAHDLHPPAAPPPPAAPVPVPVGRVPRADIGREPPQPLSLTDPTPDTASPSVRQPDTPRGADVSPAPASEPLFEPTVGTGAARRAHVLLFGRPAITVDGAALTRGLRTLSLEVAAYLAFHPAGADGEALATNLLPDHDPRKARNQIYRAIAVLRDVLTAATGDTAAYLTSGPAGYRLNPDHVSVDLWDFHHARRHAGRARDDATRITALTHAAELYQARPLGDTAYDWSTPHITAVEHHAVDVLADLADLYAADNPDRALTYLDQAITLTPHVEELYCHAMRIHATRGRLDSVRRTYQRLRDALDTLDVDPAPATDALMARLTRDPATPTITHPTVERSRRIIRPATRPGDLPGAGS
ncbi:BTAD domain-containing putative transcriptional regulator [Frankia sp. CiP3]|uniref:BTAD domain-containing putative transcriptional regulator n=1 Tax=Frankia sp. CiP3 TaxID=2880971 RepID=UPI001EF45A5C|nr:BTAD domain-containing putative transcriptional regulator [Frankia sp. CiP3]